MNNKKRIVNLEYFKEMLQISPRIPNQQFDELPFEEEILSFVKELGHNREIKMITDVNINKLHQPWRSFAAVINKFLSGKSTGEDFVYHVKHKDAKKSNEMYYPRFTKVIVNLFMTKDQSIPRRNKVNWHYARDDHMFTTIKLVSRHQNTQQYGVIFPIKLTNEDIKNSESYKEYYAIASGAEPPKTKASVRKKQSSSDTTVPPPTKGKRLKTLAKVDKPSKEKQPAKSSTAKGADEGTSIILGVLDVPNYESNNEEISWKLSDKDDDIDDDEEAKDEESFDPIVRTPSHDDKTDDEDNDEDSDVMNVEGDKRSNEKDDADELYRDVNINLEGQQQSSSVSSCFVSNMLNSSPDTRIDSIFDSTPWVDVLVSTAAEPPLLSTTTLPSPTISIIPHVQQTPAPSPANVPSSYLQGLPNFGSLFRFDHRLKTLETNFSEFMQTNQFAEAVYSILGIIDKYIDHRMNEAVKLAVRLQSDRLRDEAQAENEDFLNKLDENIQKIIKEQVKEQVKVQVSKILPKIEKTINEQLEAEVLNRSSNSFKKSYVVATDLSELELKKILLEKIESNKSIYRSDEQKNLYKALVDAYEYNKLILDTYRDTVILKRRRDDMDKDEEPFAGSNQGGANAHYLRFGRTAPQAFETGATDDQLVEEASQHPHWFQKQAKPLTPDSAWNKTLPATHGPFAMNRPKVDTLTPELLADWNNPEVQQYPHDLLKPLPLIPNSRGRRIITFDHFINNDLEYLRGGTSSQKYTTSVKMTKAADYGHIKWIEDLVPQTM
uniref:Retrovirus-related Pol polyprotein from transposon TNT 1-94 n=1 Tax=Tanacetum cinerariifolium TaxID=118510 RepID=A0A699IJJ7_TANCI|nr:hypothetical protein [Tanacetum cinerariifolium]